MNAKHATCFVTAVLLLVVAGSAHAATLFTPPLAHNFVFGSNVRCKLTNVADEDTKVRAQILWESGNVQNDSGAVILGPRESIEVESVGSGRSYCRFDVVGDSHRVRASACGAFGWNQPCETSLPAF